jgi:hypothetical protein
MQYYGLDIFGYNVNKKIDSHSSGKFKVNKQIKNYK